MANKCAAANRRYAIEFVSHWFYNIIGFGGGALPAPAAELGRYPFKLTKNGCGQLPFSNTGPKSKKYSGQKLSPTFRNLFTFRITAHSGQTAVKK